MACLTYIFKIMTFLLFICKINMNFIRTEQERQIGEIDTVSFILFQYLGQFIIIFYNLFYWIRLQFCFIKASSLPTPVHFSVFMQRVINYFL